MRWTVPYRSSSIQRRLAKVIHGLLLLANGSAMAASKTEQVEFNPAFFPGGAGAGQFDITRFNAGNVVLPGTYRSDIYVNGTWIGREELQFVSVEGQSSAQLCIDRAMLIRLGIDIDGVPQKAAQADTAAPTPFPAKPVCGDVSAYIPGATVTFDSGESKLEVQVPQLYMARTARGYVSPEHWDSGVSAGFVRYNANVYNANNYGQSSNSAYIGLNTGLNLGDWNFRHNGSYSRNTTGSGYQRNATFVQRGLAPLQSQLMMGEIYTSGEMFDSVRLRGVTLATDDRMMPDSLTGYAPIVRGVAETNARVSVRQRGVLLDEVSVPPGPFVIEDLFPTGYGGDLDVTVTEADGRKRRFVVPFASNANLLRPGYQRYAVSAGVIDELSLTERPWLMQGTYQRGLNDIVTAYTGANFSEGYYSPLIGAAFNTPIGAVSFDLTASQTEIPGADSMQGQSVQFRYNKNFAETGTNFALGAFRYSTDGFLGVRDAAQFRETASHGGDTSEIGRVRERLDLSLSQNMSQGSVYMTGSSQQYWSRKEKTLDFSIGYSNSWRQVSYTVSAQRSRDLATNRSNDQIDVTFSIPLGSAPRSPMLSTSLSHSDQQDAIRSGVSGTLGERNQFSYGASASRTQGSQTNTNSTDVDLTYRGQYAETSAGFSQGSGYRSNSFGVSGGVVAHPGGVTLTPELGDTFGIVHAPGAEGAAVGSGGNTQIGGNGYAVVPYLVPYRSNSVELDPKGMSHDVELKNASQNVAPKAGSVVMMAFETSTGRAVLINATQVDGSPIPYGADVFDEHGANVGVVGQAGKMFVRVAQDRGELTVRWGEAGADACRVPFDLGSVKQAGQLNFPQLQGVCKS
ncbi:fimbria/pilus outer membrane usher protein [Pseudomonas sp. KCJK9016]|uniref:fimbria/pilus outer membrane usher protein n=1 Tax=Pseudomonas sp. KCJK9016 TaxID=3344556 RepID=UPI00390608EA